MTPLVFPSVNGQQHLQFHEVRDLLVPQCELRPTLKGQPWVAVAVRGGQLEAKPPPLHLSSLETSSLVACVPLPVLGARCPWLSEVDAPLLMRPGASESRQE